MPVSGAPGNFPIRIEPKFLVMKMSAIEEIGPIGVQVGRQAAPGEIAEINNNYKEGKAQFTKHHLDLHRHRIYDLCMSTLYGYNCKR